VTNLVFENLTGISGVKSREDLVMSNTDLSTVDPFGAAPFKLPSGTAMFYGLNVTSTLLGVMFLCLTFSKPLYSFMYHVHS